ncbi:MAG TPA: putative Ig domain-containing protein [Burkholderiales bacterium]|nr:putative Ig domain-containing protein [Burkholderiales bacterium]
MANDTINATDGLNTINYELGDGVDSVSFALPRSYQYAEFLAAAENGLNDLSTFTGTDYTNSYFATANQSLVDALPYDISSTLSAMRQSYVWGSGYVAGKVSPAAAQAAFDALIDWINAPAGNVIQFGPGIKPTDLTVQVGATADFGGPQSTPVQFALALNNEAGIVFGLAGTQAVAGDTSVPPVINMQFQFADGTSANLTDLLSRPGQGVIGTQTGTDGSDFLRGSLSDDTLLGNGGNDKLDGGAGADQLFGGTDDDVISGGSGNDTIYGEDGSDVMATGKDGGFMSGGPGDDVYCFNRGDGPVTIDNQDWDGSGVDTISFGADVAPSDLVASVDPSSGNLTLGIVGTADTITIPWFDPWSGMATRADEAIDRVQFFDADGTAHVYDLASLVDAAFPDPSAADPSASVSLVTPGSAKRSYAAAGGEAARSYALTGNLFPSENHAPTAIPIADQSATQDVAFSYAVPSDTFADVDVGDTLKYSATRADGSALPSWLNFNADTGTFSGTPSNADAGSLSVKLSATDSAGASASSVFALNVANVNDAPTVAHSIADKSATQDVAFSYVVPSDTFADIDVGDTLKYSATQADGSELPSWLKFDSATGTFSGTPSNADVGSLNLKLSATDSAGASASSVFALNVANVNDVPAVAHAIADQSATQDVAFSYVMPSDSFADIDVGDTLKYSATLADGSALPSWLKFNADTGTFSGTPSNADVGSLSVKLSATDNAGANASSVFALNVANVNDVPTVAHAIADQGATQDVAFSYVAPADTFSDIDVGDALKYSATQADGSALPSWLKFDSATGTFSGTPANADVGALNVKLSATDNAGASASSVFALNVANVNDAPTVAHEIPDQNVTQGVAFSYVVPVDTFADIDVGDTLKYSATQADGSALPSWLKFDSGGRTFSGTPATAGNWTIQVQATDLSGSSVSDEFVLDPVPVAPPPADPPPPTAGRTITGTRRKDRLYGTSGDDTINGGKGNDVLSGRGGNDALWGGSGNDRLDGGAGDDDLEGGGGHDELSGGSGNDVLRGGSGNDRLGGGAGDDDLEGGSGNDGLSGGSGNDVLRGGSGSDLLEGGADNDYMRGGSGNDRLRGGRGDDVLQGNDGNDQLTDMSGNSLLDGGKGNDKLTEGSGNSLLVGGKGNDHLYLGGGYDIIAFNRGDGRDVVSSGNGGTVTLSLGGGIRYKDLSLRRSGNDLILETGKNDRITFAKWYEGTKYQAVSGLQVVAEVAGHEPQIATYDFTDLVGKFDSARKQDPGLSKWTLTNAVTQFQLSSTEALGGDLAYQYGAHGTLAGVALHAAQDTLGSGQFGKEAQALNGEAKVKGGLMKLS